MAESKVVYSSLDICKGSPIQMLSRVVLFMISKYGQIITPFIWSRNNIRKTRNNREIKGSKPMSQDFFHFGPVELPIDPLIMESPGE
jgi:hypothetical protein